MGIHDSLVIVAIYLVSVLNYFKIWVIDLKNRQLLYHFQSVTLKKMLRNSLSSLLIKYFGDLIWVR